MSVKAGGIIIGEMLVGALNNLRGLFRRERLIPVGILLFSFFFRVIQIDTAFFGPEQAWIAQASWKLANLQEFPTHMYSSSASFSQLPLTTYIAFIPYLFSDSIFALQIYYLLLNLLAVGLCWWFARRYWGMYVATMATLVYACMPWAILNSLRIWPNTLLPPVVMIWAVGCGLAFADKKPRWLMLAWAAAWLALQLHVSGILLLVALFILMWLYRLQQGWRHALGGSILAFLPALPWVYAQVIDVAYLGLNFSTSAGRSGFRINFEQIFQFFTARDLAASFISDGRDNLFSRLAYMNYLAPIWLMFYFLPPLFLVWRYKMADERLRPLYMLLVLWCALSLGFTFVAEAHYTIVYYLPVLPAPCIALALFLQNQANNFPRLGMMLTAALLVLCILNLNAVWIIDQQINEDIRRGDLASHAFSTGDYAPPLNWQLEMARQIRQMLEAGDASELILVFHVDIGESSDYLSWPFTHLLREHNVRVLDSKQSHLLYPQRAVLYLWNERESELKESLKAELQFLQQVGSFHLYQQAGNARPAPWTPLNDRPAYENGLSLVGYDELQCEGSWKLHWLPGITGKDNEVHFFVHLLDADEEILLQRDLRVYDVRDWREGDQFVTNFEFGQELPGLPIETIRVGLYHYSYEKNSNDSGIPALDEQGQPTEYAIDIPFGGACA